MRKISQREFLELKRENPSWKIYRTFHLGGKLYTMHLAFNHTPFYAEFLWEKGQKILMEATTEFQGLNCPCEPLLPFRL